MVGELYQELKTGLEDILKEFVTDELHLRADDEGMSLMIYQKEGIIFRREIERGEIKVLDDLLEVWIDEAAYTKSINNFLQKVAEKYNLRIETTMHWYIIYDRSRRVRQKPKLPRFRRTIPVAENIVFEKAGDRSLPSLKHLQEKWRICYDYSHPDCYLSHPSHLEIRAKNRKEVREILGRHRELIEKYLLPLDRELAGGIEDWH